MFSLRRKGIKKYHIKRPIRKGFLLKTITLFSIILFFVLLYLFFKTDKFSVKSIKVVLHDVTCVDEGSIKTSSNILNKNFFTINETKITQSLKKKFSCINKITFNKSFPTKVQLDIFGRKGAVIIVRTDPKNTLDLNLVDATPSSQTALLDFETLDSGEKYLVDLAGFIFDKENSSTNLEQIYYEDFNLNIGKQLKQNIISNSLTILDQVKKQEVVISNQKITGNNLLTDGKPRLVFALDKDPKRQITSLQLILQKAKMNSKEVNLIDLRFDKPVVIYSSKK